MKKFINMTSVLAIILTFTACSSNSVSSSSFSKTENEHSEASYTRTSEIKEPESTTQDITIQETIMSILEDSMKKSFGENVKIQYDETTHCYMLASWIDGFAKTLFATTGDITTIDEWNQLIDDMKFCSNYLLIDIRKFDPEANLSLSVLHDEDPDFILLSILNGKVIYNIMDNQN